MARLKEAQNLRHGKHSGDSLVLSVYREELKHHPPPQTFCQRSLRSYNLVEAKPVWEHGSSVSWYHALFFVKEPLKYSCRERSTRFLM